MRLLFAGWLACVALPAGAQVKAEVNQLAFMAGEWRGKMEWGEIEEYWSEPMGENMMCSFRCISEGKPVFYEFVVIESKGGVPTLKLRHFNPGSIAWEDKENPYEYSLVELTDKKCVFESADKKTRLGYERQRADLLVAVLEQEKNGKVEHTEFLYTKTK